MRRISPSSFIIHPSSFPFRCFMLAKELRPGTIVNYAGAPCLIESVSVQSPSARGAATLYKFRAGT